ncbi:hypothetical protein MMPV_005373 [Pyropia vietnamensis]
MGNVLGCFKSNDPNAAAAGTGAGAGAKPSLAKKATSAASGAASQAKAAAGTAAGAAKSAAGTAADAAKSAAATATDAGTGAVKGVTGMAGKGMTKAKSAVLGGAPPTDESEAPAEEAEEGVTPVKADGPDGVTVTTGEKASDGEVVAADKAAEAVPAEDDVVDAAPVVAASEPLLPVTSTAATDDAPSSSVPVVAAVTSAAGVVTAAAVAVPTDGADAEGAAPSSSADGLGAESARSPSPDTIVPKAPEFKAVGLEEAGAKISDAPEDSIPETPVVDHHVPAPLPPRPVVVAAPEPEAKPDVPDAAAAASAAAAAAAPSVTTPSASSPMREALVTDPTSPPKVDADASDEVDPNDPNRASYGGSGDVSASIKERQAAFSHPTQPEEDAGAFGSRLKFGAVEKNEAARVEAARHRGMVFDVVSGEEITEAEYRRRLHLRGIVEENVNKYEELQKAEALQQRELAIQKATLASRRKDQPGSASPSSLAMEGATAPSEASMEPESLTPSVAVTSAVPLPVTAATSDVAAEEAQPPVSTTTVTTVTSELITVEEGAEAPVAA